MDRKPILPRINKYSFKLYTVLAYYIVNGNLDFLDKESNYRKNKDYQIEIIKLMLRLEELRDLLNSDFYKKKIINAKKKAKKLQLDSTKEVNNSKE